MPNPTPEIDSEAPLVLASGSAYRAEMLRRLPLPFEASASNVDETALPAEQPEARAKRLATAKAQALGQRFPDRWILGSDQVAALGSVQLGKPGNVENARAQLQQMRGQSVDFWTALSLWYPASQRLLTAMDHTRVKVRALSDAEIDRYLQLESPLDCAGSFKVEGLGISLFEAVESNDPTALIGLPLIALCDRLRAIGVALP